MRGRDVVALVALGFVLEVLAGLWPVAGRLFDPLLAIAVLAALPGRTGTAFAVALVTGLLADGWSSRWIGEQALAHLLIAYPLALLGRRVDLLVPLPALLAFLVATPASWAIGLAVGRLFDAPAGAGVGPLTWAAAAAVNGLFGMLLWHVLRRRDRLAPA
ncbi:MAG: hypothetical protein Kow0062_23900 [Acidobacteriota bacterium]|nr:MAG: hypothetical protein D6738_05325 [Acidobacteriota bacterium]